MLPVEHDVVADADAGAGAVAPSAETDAAFAVAQAAALGASFRLRRWPRIAELRVQRYHLRLASCLSARHIGVDELIRSSNVGRSQCEEFLATLLAEGVLDIKPAPAALAAPAQAAASAGLPSEIPRRLG